MKLQRKTNKRRTNEEIDTLIYEYLNNNNDYINIRKVADGTGINHKTTTKRLPEILDKIRNKKI
jgi:hypothetical protein